MFKNDWNSESFYGAFLRENRTLDLRPEGRGKTEYDRGML